MTDVYEKCQEFEEKRLSFFRETLFSLHGCLDISTDPNLASTYADMKQVITAADASKDLKWWSQNHGTGMPTNWPVFEEYTPDLHNISKKERKIVNQMINHDSVTLTHVNHHPLHSNQSNHVLHTNTVNNHHLHIHPHSCPPPISASSNHYGLHSGPSGLHSTCVSVNNKPPAHLHSSPAAGANHGSNGICNSSSAKNSHHHINENSIIGHSSSSSSSSANRKNAASNNGHPGHSNGGDKSGVDANPFDDEHEDWDEYPKDALIDNGEPGVPVRALYDYEGAEADELSFKQGEEFEKLEDEDEQGWCKGRKDGRVGLYPANYVEAIPLPLPVKWLNRKKSPLRRREWMETSLSPSLLVYLPLTFGTLLHLTDYIRPEKRRNEDICMIWRDASKILLLHLFSSCKAILRVGRHHRTKQHCWKKQRGRDGEGWINTIIVTCMLSRIKENVLCLQWQKDARRMGKEKNTEALNSTRSFTVKRSPNNSFYRKGIFILRKEKWET